MSKQTHTFPYPSEELAKQLNWATPVETFEQFYLALAKENKWHNFPGTPEFPIVLRYTFDPVFAHRYINTNWPGNVIYTLDHEVKEVVYKKIRLWEKALEGIFTFQETGIDDLFLCLPDGTYYSYSPDFYNTSHNLISFFQHSNTSQTVPSGLTHIATNSITGDNMFGFIGFASDLKYSKNLVETVASHEIGHLWLDHPRDYHSHSHGGKANNYSIPSTVIFSDECKDTVMMYPEDCKPTIQCLKQRLSLDDFCMQYLSKAPQLTDIEVIKVHYSNCLEAVNWRNTVKNRPRIPAPESILHIPVIPQVISITEYPAIEPVKPIHTPSSSATIAVLPPADTNTSGILSRIGKACSNWISSTANYLKGNTDTELTIVTNTPEPPCYYNDGSTNILTVEGSGISDGLLAQCTLPKAKTLKEDHTVVPNNSIGTISYNFASGFLQATLPSTIGDLLRDKDYPLAGILAQVGTSTLIAYFSSTALVPVIIVEAAHLGVQLSPLPEHTKSLLSHALGVGTVLVGISMDTESLNQTLLSLGSSIGGYVTGKVLMAYTQNATHVERLQQNPGDDLKR